MSTRQPPIAGAPSADGRSTTESFVLEGFRGEVSARFSPTDLPAEVARLTDPASAEETIHWGRNYLYRTRLQTDAGPLEVVVKQFRNKDLKSRLRRRWGATKAARSWRAALAMEHAGIATAAPVMWIESTAADGPSFFVSKFLPEVLEARYLFRAANQHRESEVFPQIDFDRFLERLGDTLRAMHESGFFHRDLSIGNVLLNEGADTLYVVDLNRSRRLRRLSLSQRSRDLCRLAIFRPEHQRRFFNAYWRGQAPPLAWAVYQLFRRSFLFKIEGKKRVRAWLRAPLALFRPRTAHAHIPEAQQGAARRDKIVWDYLSDQPHQHASRWEKLQVRFADAPSHLRLTWIFIRTFPRIRRRYRELKESLYRQPVPFRGIGVALRPWPQDPPALLAAVEDLRVRHVLLRLHPWEDDHDAEETLAQELTSRGLELSFALPQIRDLVKDPQRWRRKVAELAERFTPYGKAFQVGQAINRSKWGVWNFDDYASLARIAAEELRRYPGVEILGPGVIDFELHATAAYLNHPALGVELDGLASLLYVDRRGRPENRQLSFDTVDKTVLLQAIADTARHCAGRSWITEVNWPLWEGPHSPAGRKVSVNEAEQADYLARYYLLALGTGLVERVFWWQIIARGYGLISPAEDQLRRRPAFAALAHLTRTLVGSSFLGPLPAPAGCHLYPFEHPTDGQIIAGWCEEGERQVELPGEIAQATEQDGKSLDVSSSKVLLTPSVRYFRIVS